jgi:outer membrane protein assembly factor BamB
LTGTSASGARLYALSAKDGQTLWGPTDLGQNSFGSAANAAFDADEVFTINGSGLVSAFDAATGEPVWSRSLSSDIFAGPPVAVAGIVYVVVDGVLHALDEATGAPLWTASSGGSPTSVAYTPSLLVLEYIEGTVSGLNPTSGASLWHTSGCCSGGGGDIPEIYQGHVFAPDFWGTNTIFDVNGNALGSFSASAVPAFENGLGFFMAASTLEAHDLNGMVKWSFAGDQKLVSTPLAAGGAVYQGSSAGKLYALDEVTGQVTWQEDVGAPIPAANQTSGLTPTTGLAASDQLLVVPTASAVLAYGN